jgi:hypothetical protein
MDTPAPAQKFQIVYWSVSERERVEYIIDEIVRRLRKSRRIGQSEREVRNGVVIACSEMMRAGMPRPKKPAVMREQTKDLCALADQLYIALEKFSPQSSVLASEEREVFKTPKAKDEFLDRLRRLRHINYRAPPPNYDQVKELSAFIAHFLVRTYSMAKPTNTVDGLFRSITGDLYEVARPSSDGRPSDLKRACQKVIDGYSKVAL